MTRDEEKADIDYKLLKKQLEDYPKVKKQAKVAIIISIIAIIVAAILGVIDILTK